MLIWRVLPERSADPGPPPGTVEIAGEDVFVRAADGRLKLLDIEVDGSRMTGRLIF